MIFSYFFPLFLFISFLCNKDQSWLSSVFEGEAPIDNQLVMIACSSHHVGRSVMMPKMMMFY